MAETNQRKIADPFEIDEDDPFAELTRIMGFDPRKPVATQPLPEPQNARPAAVSQITQHTVPVAAPSGAADLADDDDFGIDLEKELLGGFDDFDTPSEPAPPPALSRAELQTGKQAAPAVFSRAAAPAFAPVSAPTPAELTAADNDDDEFEDALNGAIDWEPMEAELASATQSAVVGQPLDEAPTDQRFAAAAEATAPVVDDQLDADLAAELDLGLSALEEDQPAAVEPVHGVVASWSEPETSAAADAWSAPDEHDAAGVAALEAPGTAAYDEQAEDEPLAEFDLADLDLHDEEHDEQPVETVDRLEPEQAVELAELDLHDDAHDEWQVAPAEQAQAMPVAARAVEERLPPQPAKEAPPVDVFADVDMDFSAAFDEALDDAGSGAAPEPAAPIAAERREAPAAPIADAKPEHSVRAASDDVDLALEDELSALLEQEQQQSPAQQSKAAPAVAAVPSPAVVDRPRGNFLSDPRWAAVDAAEEDESVSASRVLRPAASAGRFDQAELSDRRSSAGTVLTGRHANFQVPSRPQPQAIDDLDDLLDAMEHEVQAPKPVSAQAAATARAGQPQQPSVAAAATAAAVGRDFAGDAPAPQTPDVEDDGVPEIDTIDVPEPAIALADDLDLPNLAYEEDEPQRTAAYDDLEAEFAASFQRSVANDAPAQAARPQAGERGHSEVDFASLYRPAPRQSEATASADEIDFEPLADEDERQGYDDFEKPGAAARQHERYVDLDFGGDGEDHPLPAAAAYQQVERPRRFRGPLVAALVGGVALLGGAGALTLSYYGDGKADAPVLVRADDGPVKVKPENPGGTAVPNQENKVYDAVKGTAAAQPAAPAQPKLVTTQEEPVDVAAVDKAEAAPDPIVPLANDQADAPDADAHVGSVSALPGVETAAALPGVDDVEDIIGKAEDRVDPVTDADQDVPADDGVSVAPRKVRTMMVRSDGTLVPREEPAAAGGAQDAAAEVALPPAEDETGAVQQAADQPAEQASADPAVPVKTVKSTKLNAEGKPAGETVPPKAVRSTKVDADGKPQIVASASEPAANGASRSWQAPADTQDAAAQPAAAEPAPQPKPVPQSKPAKAAAAEQPKPKETKPVEVASANAEPTTAPVAAGTWSVQIASQPSADSAKSTYQDLAKRYASVLDGRGVNIVKADIEGKGTYWRVRVPAKSRDDAVSLCTNYKAAGGNCFVSK